MVYNTSMHDDLMMVLKRDGAVEVIVVLVKVFITSTITECVV